MWTRFFPLSAELRRLLAQGEVGEAKYVRSDFCVPILHVERSVKKELGAGATLDLGIYCLQFSLMVFNGEKPESVQAMGTCLETGESATFTSNKLTTWTNDMSGSQLGYQNSIFRFFSFFRILFYYSLFNS